MNSTKNLLTSGLGSMNFNGNSVSLNSLSNRKSTKKLSEIINRHKDEDVELKNLPKDQCFKSLLFKSRDQLSKYLKMCR